VEVGGWTTTRTDYCWRRGKGESSGRKGQQLTKAYVRPCVYSVHSSPLVWGRPPCTKYNYISKPTFKPPLHLSPSKTHPTMFFCASTSTSRPRPGALSPARLVHTPLTPLPRRSLRLAAYRPRRLENFGDSVREGADRAVHRGEWDGPDLGRGADQGGSRGGEG
jgi:hypothetical protein